MGALDGLKVVDFGQWIAGPLTALMLADQGADVVHIDPPGGPRWKSPANAALMRNKRLMTVDLKSAAGAASARSLMERADVVIENFRPGVMDRLGLGADASLAVNPRLVYCSIPGFAPDDPRAGVAAWEGVVAAAAGTYRAPEGLGGGDGIRFSALTVPSSFGALASAVAIVMALIARERDGRGQKVEVPLYDAMFLAIGANGLTVNGKPEGGRPDDPWIGQFETSDGRWVRLNLASYRFLTTFVDGLGLKEWYDRGFVEDARPGRLPRGSELRAEQQQALVDLFRSRTASQWDDFAREVGVPLSMVRTAAEWMATPQATGSGIVTSVDDPEIGPASMPGAAVRLFGSGEAEPRPRAAQQSRAEDVIDAWAPQPAFSAAPKALSSVLEGMRVIDLTMVLAGPTAGRTLAEYGAEVIKINNPNEDGAGFRWNPHRYHTDVNRGKATILLDLKQDAGQEVFWKLADGADVVLQNFRRGVAERLGIGYEQVRARNPNVVYGSVSFYGYGGPWETAPGYEPNAQASTGISARSGGDGPPGGAPFAVNDYGTGLLGAFALGLGLFHRERTGHGQAVQASLAATGTFLQLPYALEYEGKKWDEPAGPDARGWGPLQRLYQASDGWFFLGARGSELPALAAIEGLAGASGLSGDALAAALEAAFVARPAAEWVAALVAAGIGAQVLKAAAPLLREPWAVERGLSVTRIHKGGDEITTIGPPPRLSRTPVRPGRPAAPPGSDAEEVLELAGMSASLPELLAARAVVME